MTFKNTNDYSSVAPYYDQTRNMPEHLLEECYQRIFRITGFPKTGKILDAGCGTGQLSRSLVKRGYSVIGIDVSEQMLAIARDKLSPGDDAVFEIGDVREINYPDNTFNAMVASKLFQHVGHWETAVDELVRVIKDGGLFIYINETGAFKNRVRLQFKSICQVRGYKNLYVGINDRTQLGVYLQQKQARPVAIETGDLAWDRKAVYREELEYFRLKLYAEFWDVPDEDYAEILREVHEWVVAQPGGEDTTEIMHPYLKAEVYQVRK